jgi:putative hemolysin
MNWSLILWILPFVFMIFFSGIEMAFMSASRLNIELKRKQGSQKGRVLGKFVNAPAFFLGMTILGSITSLTFFVLLTNEVARPLWEIFPVHSRLIQIIVEILFNALVILVFIEFIPRALFRAHSNVLLNIMAFTADFFFELFYPLIASLFLLSNWILKYVFNVRVDKKKSPLSRSDLRFLFQDNVRDMAQAETSTKLLENAQELPNIRIRQCLVPRKEIISAEINTSISELVKKMNGTKRSRIIIYEENIDNILGYIHQLDLFKKPVDIKSILLNIPAVPESMSAVDLINKFSNEAKSVAWVVDEFGGTAGIITMEDVLEELFGEIHDEYDTEIFVEEKVGEDEYLFSGRLELDYLEKKYNLEFRGNDSETLSGYIINHHETIPSQKERIIIGDYVFDIITVTDTRIELVKFKKLK